MGPWLPPSTTQADGRSGYEYSQSKRCAMAPSGHVFVVRLRIVVSRPGVRPELREKAGRQRAAVGHRRVRLDAGDAAHAGDDGRDRLVAQAEAERQLGER